MKTIGISIDGIIRDNFRQFEDVYKRHFIYNPSVVEMDGEMNLKESTEEEEKDRKEKIKLLADKLITKPIESPDLTNHYSFENLIEDISHSYSSMLTEFDSETKELKPMDSYEKGEKKYLDPQAAYDYFRFEERPLEIYAQAPEVKGAVDALHKLGALGKREELFDVVLLSTLKGKAITATYSFLGLNGVRNGHIKFVHEDFDKWDHCDILFDIMPEAIQSVEEGKEIIKINHDFNKWDDVDHSYDSLRDAVRDKKLIKHIKEFCS